MGRRGALFALCIAFDTHPGLKVLRPKPSGPSRSFTVYVLFLPEIGNVKFVAQLLSHSFHFGGRITLNL